MIVCEENKRISSEVWDFIDNVGDVGEESLTDYLVWQWRKLNKKFNYLNVEKHNRHFENFVSGADFELELWFLYDNQTLSFVFQAKKIFKEYDGYTGKFNYQNGNLRQIDVLIDYATANRKLPFYILYSQPNNDTRTKCNNDFQDKAIFITDAITINNFTQNFRNRRLSKNRILSDTLPFHCLFCCPLMELNVEKFLNVYFGDIADNFYPNENNNTPEYVIQIANNEIQNIDSIINDNNLNRFRNIGVLDLRTEK